MTSDSLLFNQVFNRLDKYVQTNVPASTLWHSSAHTGLLGRTRMQGVAVVTIPMLSYFTLKGRRLTWQKVSVPTLLKKSPSVYTDPLVDKECQNLIECFRLN